MLVRVGPLVRATSSTSVVIWAELTRPCSVVLSVQPFNEKRGAIHSITVRTVTVGGRHYVAPQLQGLQSGSWYRYYLTGAESDETLFGHPAHTLQCFRTLDDANTSPETPTPPQPLRIAYGSCRKANVQSPDALETFGHWLVQTAEQREELWPHVLLLVGDQIYGDEPPEALYKQAPHLRQGAQTFDDFSLLYEYAWTCTQGVRQALGVLPTFMLFDDHEITNNWNGSPTWRARALQAGKEQLLVDGLIAYWLYQGWGNLTTRDEAQMPLLRIMKEAEESGEDALAALRASIKSQVYEQTMLPWHYEIPTTPSIFVTNTRTERTAVFSQRPAEIYAPGRIVSSAQLQAWHTHLNTQRNRLTILASSVPMLLPPTIGLAEYLMGRRLWHKSIAPLRWIGQLLARLQLFLAFKTSFDHWPLYTESWHEMLQIWRESQKDLLVLSGDVHFSYATSGVSTHTTSDSPRLYQFVCTPLQNKLSASDRRKIELQSHFSRFSYGRLRTQMLPLQATRPDVALSRNILYENTLAMVTLSPRPDARYDIQQTYLSPFDGRLEPVATITIPAEKHTIEQKR